MLVAANIYGITLFIENLVNTETFPVTNQEKQEESFAKALEML
jgi:hypothetical protein